MGVVILTLIVISTITFCLETLPWYYDPDPGRVGVCSRHHNQRRLHLVCFIVHN